MLAGLAALMLYLRPGLAAPDAYWPLRDVHVYWWGGEQASHGGTLYAPGTRHPAPGTAYLPALRRRAVYHRRTRVRR
jgi:hypothetical protein